MEAEDDVTSFEQLQAMSPVERREHFRSSLVLDPARYRPNERALVARLDAATLEREERLRGHAS